MINGTVHFYHSASGFGIIRRDRGGPDAFVHVDALNAAGLTALSPGQRLTFELRTDARGQTCAHGLACVQDIGVDDVVSAAPDVIRGIE
ncbi:cold shock domain-containing protein [Sphingomonas sp. HF-S3]|uniref:Cold shock domain-containing protein n=1 Tax=Sphingomonas rustica TaxID=3103142 RepID=A0ABV0BDK2_9SPHN